MKKQKTKAERFERIINRLGLCAKELHTLLIEDDELEEFADSYREIIEQVAIPKIEQVIKAIKL